MPRKTDSSNPEDWVFLARSDIEAITALANHEIAHLMCRSKLAEVVEKVMKAELIRLGWFLERTHDLEKLLGELRQRGSDLIVGFEPLVDDLAEAYFSDRYPGFDLEDPDWPKLRAQVRQLSQLLLTVQARLGNSALGQPLDPPPTPPGPGASGKQ